jgi:hypothetical protein
MPATTSIRARSCISGGSSDIVYLGFFSAIISEALAK